jgi:hypothetical protein
MIRFERNNFPILYTLLSNVMSTHCVSSHDHWPVVRAPAAPRACSVGVHIIKSPRFPERKNLEPDPITTE